MRRLTTAKQGGRSVVNGAVAPPEAWAPTPSAELTAFEAFVGDTEAQFYRFDGASNQRSFALLGGIASGDIGFAHNWLAPGIEARGASAANGQRPSLLITGGILSAYFNGDRTTDAANSRLVIPHVTASQYITASLIYLDREDAIEPEVAAQTNHWRLHARDGLANILVPILRTGNSTRTSFGGASAFQAWTILLTITDRVAGKQWVRRGGGAWIEATLDPTTPWLDGSIYNQVSYLGRGGFTPSSGQPFKGAIRAWAMVPKIPTVASEEQAVINLVLKDTGLSDTSPGVPGVAPPPVSDAWNAVAAINVDGLTASTTHNVANDTQLTTAIAALAPGHHIVLASGTYATARTITASGTQANPVVIRAANLLGATMTGRLTISGNWVIVRGINFTNGVEFINANDSRVSRCKLTNDFFRVTSSSQRWCFDYNEISNASRAIWIRSHTGSLTNRGGCFIRNYIHDLTNTTTNAVLIGNQSVAAYDDDYDCLIEYNLLLRTLYVKAVEWKVSNVTCRYNTSRDSGNFQARTGSNSYIGGNTFRNTVNGRAVEVHGDDHIIVGNDSDNAGTSTFGAMNGNTTATEEIAYHAIHGNAWSIARRCLFSSNIGGLRIGFDSTNSAYTLRPVDCIVENHPGALSITGGATGTVNRKNSPATIFVPVASELLPSQVGPTA